MNTEFPETPGLSGAFLLGWRKPVGAAAGDTTLEQTISIIVKQAYDITASDSDPALGSLTPRADGPEIFEGDFQANLLENPDFSDGASDWQATGGALPVYEDEKLILGRDSDGDVRQTFDFGRQMRDRGFGISILAEGIHGQATPQPELVAGGTQLVQVNSASFPEADKQPIALGAYVRTTALTSAQTASARFPAMAANSETVTYLEATITSVLYESDLVPFKPEADVVVIADAPPIPVSISINGVIRYSQSGIAPQELTGLGWEERLKAPRKSEFGDVDAMTQSLPDDFQNLYFNGYRRNRRQGGHVPFMAVGDTVELIRDGGDAYGFTLPSEAPHLRHSWYIGHGVDDICLWRHRDVAMVLDTLVIEPDRDHAYAVWRACWPIDLDPDGNGPIPFDANRAAQITMVGGV